MAISHHARNRYYRLAVPWDWIGIGDKNPVFTSPFSDVLFRTASAQRRGLTPGPTQVYGFKIAPALAGEISIDAAYRIYPA